MRHPAQSRPHHDGDRTARRVNLAFSATGLEVGDDETRRFTELPGDYAGFGLGEER